MDHATYLERHHELTNAGMASAHLTLARGDAADAASSLSALSENLSALVDDGGEEATAHLQYLATHKTMAASAIGDASALLAASEPELASVVLRDSRAMLDELWKLRVAQAAREVNQ